MTLADAWKPLGTALLDYHRGHTDARLMVRSDLWEDEETAVAEYYRPDDQPLPELERRALAMCRGRVLDAGAGAGRHAIELQRRGLDVRALDVSPEAVAVMRDRGVADARCDDLFATTEETYDTVLLMMHGIGVVGDPRGLGVFLERVPHLLEPGGQVLCDSADLSISVLDVSQEAHRSAGLEHGAAATVQFQLVYEHLVGEHYPWLFIDPDTLATRAETARLHTEVVSRGARGAYLARLTRTAGR